MSWESFIIKYMYGGNNFCFVKKNPDIAFSYVTLYMYYTLQYIE